MTSPATDIITLDQIDRDASDRAWIRDGLNEDQVGHLVLRLKAEGWRALDPIEVVKRPDGRLIRTAGAHRQAAAERLIADEKDVGITPAMKTELQSVPAVVRVPAQGEDPAVLARRLAIEDVARSPRSLTTKEKRTLIAEVIKSKRFETKRQVALYVGCSIHTVTSVLQTLSGVQNAHENHPEAAAKSCARRLVKVLREIDGLPGGAEQTALAFDAAYPDQRDDRIDSAVVLLDEARDWVFDELDEAA